MKKPLDIEKEMDDCSARMNTLEALLADADDVTDRDQRSAYRSELIGDWYEESVYQAQLIGMLPRSGGHNVSEEKAPASD